MQTDASRQKARVLLYRQYDVERIKSTEGMPASHVSAILVQAFAQAGLDVCADAPIEPSSLIADGIHYGRGNGSYSALCVSHGYGFISAALASTLRSRPRIILHTWKLPWIRADGRHYRLTSRMMDLCLLTIMKRAALVILVSHEQYRMAKARFPKLPIIFVPVVADTHWWTPGPASTDILSRLKVSPAEFLLIGGNVDRDERIPALFAKSLGRKLIRVTGDENTAAKANSTYRELGVDAQCVVKVPWQELRDLYRSAWAVLTAPVANHHPAGLTSLTEALACGAPVLFPNNSTAEGYIKNGQNGILYDKLTIESLQAAAQPLNNAEKRANISRAARKTCDEYLNIDCAVQMLAKELTQVLNLTSR